MKSVCSYNSTNAYPLVSSLAGMDSDLKVVLKLTMNGEQVTLSAAQCDPVKDAQLERQQPGFTHQQNQQRQARDSAKGGEAAAPGVNDEVDHSPERRRDDADDHKRKRKHKDRRDERDRDRDKKHKSHRERDRDNEGQRCQESRGGGGSKRDKGQPATQSSDHASKACNGYGGASPADRWVRESIRVRVIDKKYHRGRLYNKKGVVIDVSGVDCFSLRVDESQELCEGLTHAMVETALPKRGGHVMILNGTHRLRRGILLERHTESAKAVVQLAGDLQVVTCSFDDVAEWVGTLGDGLDVADL